MSRDFYIIRWNISLALVYIVRLADLASCDKLTSGPGYHFGKYRKKESFRNLSPARSQFVAVALFTPFVFHFVTFSLSRVSLCQCARFALVHVYIVQREWPWTMLHCGMMICDNATPGLISCDNVTAESKNSGFRRDPRGQGPGKWENGSKASDKIFIIFSMNQLTM